MAYDSAKLDCLIPRIGAGPALWSYSSADAHATVDGSGYFTDGAARGLAANDIMIVNDTNVPTCTIHQVGDSTTIDPATLA